MNALLRKTREAGIVLSLIDGNVKATPAQRSTIEPGLIESLREIKTEIHDRLSFFNSLRRDSLVSISGVECTVWETYPEIQKVGVIFPGETQPQFYYFDQVSPKRSVDIGTLYRRAVAAISKEYFPGFELDLTSRELAEWQSICSAPTTNSKEIIQWAKSSIKFIKRIKGVGDVSKVSA